METDTGFRTKTTKYKVTCYITDHCYRRADEQGFLAQQIQPTKEYVMVLSKRCLERYISEPLPQVSRTGTLVQSETVTGTVRLRKWYLELR